MATEEQTVVDAPNGQAKPDAAGTDARKPNDDLDTILAEFDAGTKKPDAAAKKPETTTDTAATAPDKRLTAIEERLARQQVEQDLKPVIEKIRGKLPDGFFDDHEIEDYLASKAQRDPRLRDAWQNRHENPKGWDKVVDALGKQMADKFAKLPDPGATADREAVTAAVRGASTKAPEGKAPDYSRKSDQEFAKDVEEKYGFRPL